jgi:hypothetical protein
VGDDGLAAFADSEGRAYLEIDHLKTYPGQLQLMFHGVAGLTGNYRFTVDRPANTDRFTIECEADDQQPLTARP